MNRSYLRYIIYSLLGVAVLVLVWQAVQYNRQQRKEQRAALYMTHCGNCHGEKGEGLKNLYPPLTDTSWLGPEKLACLIKTGLSGDIMVNGQHFSGMMPPNTTLSAAETADIIRYIHRELNSIEKPVNQQLIRDWQSACP